MAQAATIANEETRTARPKATFKLGGVEVSVWENPTANGNMYNTTISNSYKDEKSGEWKEPGASDFTFSCNCSR
jgi:hypothetical protein